MGRDDETRDVTDAGDPTVSLPKGDLAPPPPPPDAVDMGTIRRRATPRTAEPTPEPGGRGWIWLAVVLGLTLVFVVACYVVVARAEGDRDEGPTDTPATTEATPSTEPTTTTSAPPTTQDPASITVAVLNGTEQGGWAAENAEKLAAAGYPTETTDAIASPGTTTIYVASEELRPDAAAVAAALGFPDAPVEARPAEPLASNAVDQDAPIVVVLGADSLGG